MARWTNIPEWLRGLPVDLDCHTNHGRNDGSRPWIFSLTIPTTSRGAIVDEHQRKRVDERVVADEHTREIYEYLFSHWTALQALVRPMVNT